MSAKKALKILKDKRYSISFAESVTGGKLASEFTLNEGSSKAFMLGFVVYSSKMKNQVLNVNEKTIEKYGVVSKQVAKEMALNMKNIANSTIAISTTGNAGPTTLGNTSVGEVYVGIAYLDKVDVYKLELKKTNRQEIINEITKEIWALLLNILITM